MASLGKIEPVLEGGVLRLDCGVEGLRLRKGDCLDVDLVNKTVHVWRDDDAPALPRGRMPFEFIWVSEPRIVIRQQGETSMKHTCIGKFEIHMDLIDKEPLTVLAVMARCIIVRAEALYCSRRIEYHAISDAFDPMPIGDCVPMYDVVVNNDHPPEVRFVRRSV